AVSGRSAVLVPDAQSLAPGAAAAAGRGDLGSDALDRRDARAAAPPAARHARRRARLSGALQELRDRGGPTFSAGLPLRRGQPAPRGAGEVGAALALVEPGLRAGRFGGRFGERRAERRADRAAGRL